MPKAGLKPWLDAIHHVDQPTSGIGQSSDGPGALLTIPVIIKYGDNKEFYVNPNAGFASIIDYVHKQLVPIGITSTDHVELCDECGKLLNPSDFPTMMFLTSFIKSGAEEATFVPAVTERDEHKKVTKLDLLLKDCENIMPDMYAKLKKDHHIHILEPDGKGKKKPDSAHSPRGLTPLPHSSREPSVISTAKKRSSRERSRDQNTKQAGKPNSARQRPNQ